MSIDEALKYFKNNDENAESPYWEESTERFTTPTAYAIEQGAYSFEWEEGYYFDEEDKELFKVYDGGCSWWLRSPGENSGLASYVDFRGCVMNHGELVNEGNYMAVRPALWINPNA